MLFYYSKSIVFGNQPQKEPWHYLSNIYCGYGSLLI